MADKEKKPSIWERLVQRKENDRISKEEEQKRNMQELTESLHKMRVMKKTLENKFAVLVKLTREKLKREPNNTALKRRLYNKLKFYLSYLWYTDIMLNQLEEVNDQVMMMGEMADFQQAMDRAASVMHGISADVGNFDALMKRVQKMVRPMENHFAGLDRLFESANKAREESSASSFCTDEYLEQILRGEVTVTESIGKIDQDINPAEEIEDEERVNMLTGDQIQQELLAMLGDSPEDK